MNLKNNRLIIDFIGTERESDGTEYIVLGNDSYYFDLDDEESCKFHTSWDWLMPLVLTCKERQIFGSQRLIDNIDKRLLKVDLLATYRNVVDFIEFFYNQEPVLAPQKNCTCVQLPFIKCDHCDIN